MARATSSPILQLIRRVVGDPRVRCCADEELLRRILDRPDEEAFETLVQRHGPMVLDVCRGVLANEADAEDAFQATFLVLARKARAIRRATSLASWLHGVAYRTACQARTAAARRKEYESRAAAPAGKQMPDDTGWREVRQVVHEELSGLSERYRAPLVLCYLQGRTQDEAATLLNLAKSTLKERLERGRAFLRARLVRRGLGPVALLVVSAWPAATVSAGVPVPLGIATVKALALVAAGGLAASGASAEVAALFEGVLKTMFPSKLKMATVVLVLLAAMALGAGGLLYYTQAAQPPQAPPAQSKDEPARPQPKAEPRQESIVVTRVLKGKLAEVFNPAGKSIGEVNLGSARNAWNPRLSPDGKRLALLIQIDAEVGTSTQWPSYALHVVDRNGGATDPSNLLATHLRCPSLAWSPDGKKLYVSSIPKNKLRVAENVDQVVPVGTRVYDLDRNTDSSTDLPEGHGVADVAPDGKSVLTTVKVFDRDVERLTTHFVPLDTYQPVQLGKEGLVEPRLSPDGRRVVGIRRSLSGSKDLGLFVVDIAKKEETRVALPKEFAAVQMDRAGWSQDGKRIVFQWQQGGQGPLPGAGGPAGRGAGGAEDGRGAARVSVVDLDGTNVRHLLTAPGDENLSGLDWK
jgi:RNA polymerase sigma factor (sigma-70 family)